ncbi:MAG: 4-hydroxy-tetrahydrodipicolinate reductase [Myxococcales bacterium]|nr:4-hydroxy-tetrahydrodipicolinate reductase [Myxococcales bacterium]
MSTRIAIYGVAGRMGRSIVRVVGEDGDASLAAAVGRAQSSAQGVDAGVLAGLPQPLSVPVSSDLVAAVTGCDVLIDFSLPAGTQAALAACREARRAAVVGTTGLEVAQQDALAALAEVAPVVFAPNFSVGVNVFWALARRAVEMLGEEFDLEIVEMHHRNKVDAPSGTAARLLEVAAEARGVSADAAVHGRQGVIGARTQREIGVHALRGGDVVGDHTLILAGPGERVDIAHRAHSREIFARGAVRAAKWVVAQPPGLYSMGDVLGL